MRLKSFFCIYFLMLIWSLNAQNTAPSWYIDTELEYPRSRFIAAVGEGRSRADAEAAALAGVSLFFNTQTEIRNQVIREFNEAVTNDTTDFSRRTYITESAVIRSEEEFLGVRFSSPFQIPGRQSFAALAYIDRREASSTYESKINVNMNSMNALVSDAIQETEPLYACGLLFRAIRIGDITEEYIKTAVVIDPSSGTKYASYLTQIQEARSLYRANRERLTFTVGSSSADSAGRIERKLQELLEASGCVVSAQNPIYTVSFRLNMTEEQIDTTTFVRSGITVQVEREGRALLSYSKNYPRSGHSNPSGAYNRAFLAIERDLEENFTPKLTAMIGR